MGEETKNSWWGCWRRPAAMDLNQEKGKWGPDHTGLGCELEERREREKGAGQGDSLSPCSRQQRKRHCLWNHWSEKTDPKDVGWKQPLLLTKARITWKNLSQSLGPSVDSWILGPWDEACACVFWRKTNSPVWPRYLVKDQRHRMWFSNFYPKLLSWQQKTNTVITKNWRRTRYQPKRYNHKAVSAITKYMFPKSISANRSTGDRNQKPATPQDNPGGSVLTERP